jgi:hypothetical protein
MTLQKLVFAPGVNRDSTNYTNTGGWYDINLVRFHHGFPETIGGWARMTTAAMLGSCRHLNAWAALDGTLYVGAGTHLKQYIISGGTPFDVTPIRLTTAAGDATFAAVDGSTTLTVTEVSHGAVAGAFVTFSGAVTLGGVITADVINIEYQIVSVTDADTYTVTSAVAANASDTGNGGALTVAEYQIAVGLDTAVIGTGWGAGAWGENPWGGPADTTVAGADLRLWTMDNWGEDLLSNVRDGGLYYWDKGAGLGARAVALADLAGATSTPTLARIILVSEKDRHVIAFGCDPESGTGIQDPMLIRFSSTESLIEWNTAETNTAGFLRLDSGSAIVAAVQTRQQILILTDSAVYTMQFVGAPFVFGTTEISVRTSIASANAVAPAQDVVYWMGDGLFYQFDGIVSPLPCTVSEYVFSDFNTDQASKVASGVNSADNEVWWFYPSADSDNVDRYVVYDYAQKLWYYGVLARTAWIDRSVHQNPIAASADGYLYYHEFGLDDGESNPPVGLNAWIESSQFELGSGDKFSFARRIIPDVTFRNSTAATPTVTFTAKALRYPGDGSYGDDADVVTGSATYPLVQYTNYLDTRLRGRALSIRVESDTVGVQWRLGTPRVDLRTDGGR